MNTDPVDVWNPALPERTASDPPLERRAPDLVLPIEEAFTDITADRLIDFDVETVQRYIDYILTLSLKVYRAETGEERVESLDTINAALRDLVTAHRIAVESPASSRYQPAARQLVQDFIDQVGADQFVDHMQSKPALASS